MSSLNHAPYQRKHLDPPSGSSSPQQSLVHGKAHAGLPNLANVWGLSPDNAGKTQSAIGHHYTRSAGNGLLQVAGTPVTGPQKENVLASKLAMYQRTKMDLDARVGIINHIKQKRASMDRHMKESMQVTRTTVNQSAVGSASSRVDKRLQPANAAPNPKDPVYKYAFRSRGGRLPGRTKVNQDNFIIERNLCNQRGVWLFAVCDGHGTYGHKVSGHIKMHLAKNINEAENEAHRDAREIVAN